MSLRFKKAGLAVLTALVLGGPLLQGCASTADPRLSAAVDDKPFYAWFNNLTSQVQADSKYKRIPLDTPEQSSEFMGWLHDAYRHRITKQEFAERVRNRYPNHEYETSFIMSRMP